MNAELAGVFSTVGQTIEDRYGNPVTVDADFNGKKFAKAVAGPLADLKQRGNTITWTFRNVE
ncbi:MAG: hypothetical protein A2Z25_04465 [Planctomycetes bacterium RBG_16_55_9]|nr:MAG: hypothetical protein A2Z25_04465 [Planctomycetes bacterium RBG_16_55_9]